MPDSQSPTLLARVVSILPFETEADNLRLIIRTLVRVIFLLVTLLLVALVGWMQAPSSLRIDVDPVLGYGGGTLKPDDRVPANVFSTAAYLFQYMNRWDNGEEDYQRKIIELSDYMTPSCYAYLIRDYDNRKRRGELSDRIRYLSPVNGWAYSNDLVDVRSQDEWVLQLDMHLVEYVRATKVKDLLIRYPLRVVRWDTDRESNPYGLALDCFDGKPHQIQQGNGG